MKRRNFLLCSAGLALASLLPAQAASLTKPTGRSINQFGSRLLQQLPSNDNVFFSPFSIATALAMTGVGAAHGTETEFLKTLGFSNRQQMINGFRQLLPEMTGSKKYELVSANSLWVDDTLTLHADFKRTTREAFRATLDQVDFDGDPKGSAKRINRWAAKTTRDKIKKVVTPRPDYRCVLANAIYFKGDWQEEFDKKRTGPAPFFLDNGSRVEVPMMTRRPARLAYAQAPGVTATQLPYLGGELAMTVLLPAKASSLAELEKRLKRDWTAGLAFRGTQVMVSMPKYKLKTGYQLNKPLKRLGLGTAFSNGADFRRMSPEGLKIDEVRHKAFVDVDEVGTEAAAVTTVTMVRTTSVRPSPVVFRVDRPFLFTITHKVTGTVLFAGRVLNPNA